MTTDTAEQAVDINNLPSKAKIFGGVYSLFDNSLDPRTNAVDLVKCNNCSKYGLVERCADDCPDCGYTGGLMDGLEDDIKTN